MRYHATRHILSWEILYDAVLRVELINGTWHSVKLDHPEEAELWVDDAFTHMEFVALESWGEVHG